LTNDNWARANNEDVFEISSSRHGAGKKSKKRLLGEPAL
jgi:hypothetical protein